MAVPPSRSLQGIEFDALSDHGAEHGPDVRSERGAERISSDRVPHARLSVQMTIAAIIPVKELCQAKLRLSGLLSVSERYHLATTMLEDALETVRATPTISDIVLSTGDGNVARLAETYQARIVSDSAADLNRAVDLAARQLRKEGFERIVVLPIDVPLATAGDLAALLNLHLTRQDNVTIAMARKDFGTNCLIMAPPASMPVCFGAMSGLRHFEAARERNLKAHSMCLPGFDLDLDEASDIAQFMKLSNASATWKYLTALGVLDRLADRTAVLACQPSA